MWLGKGQAAGVSCDTARSNAHDKALARAALSHDTAVGLVTRAGQGALGRATRRVAQRAGASGTTPAIRPGSPATILRWAGHDTDGRVPLGAPGALAGPIGGSCSQFGF